LADRKRALILGWKAEISPIRSSAGRQMRPTELSRAGKPAGLSSTRLEISAAPVISAIWQPAQPGNQRKQNTKGNPP